MLDLLSQGEVMDLLNKELARILEAETSGNKERDAE